MRIAIAGILLESSTFSRDVTPKERFTVLRGEEILEDYDWSRRFADLDVEPVPLLIAEMLAGGAAAPDGIDEFTAEILEHLEREGPFDAVYLHMHGALSVVGRDRAEESFVGAVRRVVGDIPIGMSMDPHGNLSEELAGLVDVAACHRRSPHVDRWLTRERVVRQLVDIVRRGRRPAKAWVRVPVLLPGERTSTTVEPGRTVFAAVEEIARRHGAIDANLWIGFYWADEPRNHAAVLVTAWDAATAAACAEEVARLYWDARDSFAIVSERSGDWTAALDHALSEDAALPLWVSDSGDNVTAGATGDVTFALAATLAHPDVARRRFLFAGLVDADALAAAIRAGVGAEVDLAIGARTDDRFAPPVRARWRVERLIEGLWQEGTVAAVLSVGTVTVSVQSSRVYFVAPTDPGAAGFRTPGLAWFEPDGYDVVVVKNGYLFPGQAERAAGQFMALTPGGTDLDPQRLGWSRLQRPMHPLDDGFEADLRAHVSEVR